MNRALSSLTVVCALFSACVGPSVAPPKDTTVAHTPERLARGAYLAHHVAECIDCHSTRDETRFAQPRVLGSEGKGGVTYDAALGFPGTIVTPNITPAALSTWTDGEIDRAITAGVSKSGRALFPLMPYPAFAGLCQDDVDAIVAYLRTLQPIEHTPPTTALSFPMSLIVNVIPKDTPRPPCPPARAEGESAEAAQKNAVARGAYLANAATCIECHSVAKRGQVVAETAWAGGRSFKVKTSVGIGTVTAPNLTPAGILGSLNEEAFLARMRAHGDGSDGGVIVDAGAMQSVMSWTAYAGMTDDDLKDLFAFLQQLPKKETPVDTPRWQPPAAP